MSDLNEGGEYVNLYVFRNYNDVSQSRRELRPYARQAREGDFPLMERHNDEPARLLAAVANGNK